MMRDHDESLLLAWVDGQLPAARQAEVEAWLAADPAAAARAAAYREQNELLRRHFAGVLAEPLPAALRGLAEKRPPARVDRGIFSWRRGYALAASLLLAVLSAAGGWLAHARWQAPQLAAVPLYRQAAVAHAVFVPDARRPVEVDQEAALLKWLSRRLGTEIRAPHLGAQGFELVGGRLLPGNHGPVAQFMYQDASGVRLTLYLSGEGEVGGETGFRFAREGEINVFYWVEGRFGYALSGQVERSVLATLAGAAYEQLLPAR